MNSVGAASQGVRWAVNCGAWSPSEGEWCRAVQLIQEEEKHRVHSFSYQADAKATLLGRLMLRGLALLRGPLSGIVGPVGRTNSNLKLTRSSRGRPIVEGGLGGSWDYNVSHAGAWVVLAAGPGALGVDVMRTRDSRVARVDEFFRLMTRQFTENEWQTIRGSGDEYEQLTSFFRHWTLKESFVKAVGTGLNINLRSLDFRLRRSKLVEGEVETGTRLWREGSETEWRFEESLLDEEHVVSVCRERAALAIKEKGERREQEEEEDCSCEKFVELSVEEILAVFGPASGVLRGVEPQDFCVFRSMERVKPF